MHKKLFTISLILNFLASAILPSPLMADMQPLLSNQTQQLSKPVSPSSSRGSTTQIPPSGSVVGDSSPLSRPGNNNLNRNTQLPGASDFNISSNPRQDAEPPVYYTGITAKTGNTGSQTAGNIKSIGNKGSVAIWGLKKQADGTNRAAIAILTPQGNETDLALPSKVIAGNVSPADPTTQNSRYAAFIYQDNLPTGARYTVLSYDATNGTSITFDPKISSNFTTTMPVAITVDDKGIIYLFSFQAIPGGKLTGTLTAYSPSGTKLASINLPGPLSLQEDLRNYQRLDVLSVNNTTTTLSLYGISPLNTNQLVVHTFQFSKISLNMFVDRGITRTRINNGTADTAQLTTDGNYLVLTKPNLDGSGTTADIFSQNLTQTFSTVLSGAPTNPNPGTDSILDSQKNQYTFSATGDGTQVVQIKTANGQIYNASVTDTLAGILGNNIVVRGATIVKISSTEKMSFSIDVTTATGEVKRVIVNLANFLQRFMDHLLPTVKLSGFNAAVGDFVINGEQKYSVLDANVGVKGLVVPGGTVLLNYTIPGDSTVHQVAMSRSAADPTVYEVYVPDLPEDTTISAYITAQNPHEGVVKTQIQNVTIPFRPPAVKFQNASVSSITAHTAIYQVDITGFDPNTQIVKIRDGNTYVDVTPDSMGHVSYTYTDLWPGESVNAQVIVQRIGHPDLAAKSSVTNFSTPTLTSMVSNVSFTSNPNDTPGFVDAKYSFNYSENSADPVNFGASVAVYQIDGTKATLIGTYQMDCTTTAGTCGLTLANLKQLQTYRFDATLKDLDHQPQAQEVLASKYVQTQHGRLIISIESDTETSNSASLKGTIAGINLKTDDAYVFYRVKDTSAWQSTLISIIDPNNGKFNAVINGLNPSTPYEYKIVVTVKGNINQHLADSPIQFFTTTAELKISNVGTQYIGREFATIAGDITGINTAKAILVLINAYDATNPQTFDLTVTNNHFQISVPVLPGGSYYYQIKVIDPAKNVLASSDLNFFQTKNIPVLASFNYADAVDTVIDYYGKIDGLLPTDNVALVISTPQQVLIHNLTSSEMDANGNVAATVTGLTLNTTYALRLRVTDTVSPSKRTYDLPEIQYVSTTSGPDTALIDTIKKIYSFSDDGTVAWRNDDPTHTPIFGRSLDATKTLYYTRSINNLYQTYLGRSADPAGLNDKLQRLLAENMTLADVGREILNSQEFRNNLAGIQNYVNQIGYRNMLNREGEPAGLAYWTGLVVGRTLDQMTAIIQNGFLNSVEYQNRLVTIRNLVSPAYRNQVTAANVNFLTSAYRNIFNRAPSNSEIAAWFPFGGQQGIIQTILNSGEFHNNIENPLLDQFVGKLTDPSRLIVPGSALRNIYWDVLARDVASGKIGVDIFFSQNLLSYFLQDSRNSLPGGYKISDAFKYLIPTVFLATNKYNPVTTVVQGFQNYNYVPGDTVTAQFGSTDADKGDTVALTYQLFRREGENGTRTLVASGALNNGQFSYTAPDGSYDKLYVYDLVVTAKSTQDTGANGGQSFTYLQFHVGPPYNINHMPKGFQPDPNAGTYFGYRLDSKGNNTYTLTLLELSTGKTTVFSITSTSTPVYYGVTTNRNAVVFTRTAPNADLSDPYPNKIDIVSLKYPQDQDPQEMVEWRFHAPSGIKVDFSQTNRVVVTNIRMGTEIVTVDVSNIKQLNVVWNGWLTKNRSNDTLNGAGSPDPPFYAYKIDQSSGQDILSTRFLPTGEIIQLEQAALNSITFIGITAAKNTGFTYEGFAVWTTKSSSGVSVSVDYIGQGNRSPAQYVRINGAPADVNVDAFNQKDAIVLDSLTNPNYFRVISFTKFPGQLNPTLVEVPEQVSREVLKTLYGGNLGKLLSTYFHWGIIPNLKGLVWNIYTADSYPRKTEITVRDFNVLTHKGLLLDNVGYKVISVGLYDPTTKVSSSDLFYYKTDGALDDITVFSSNQVIGGAIVLQDPTSKSWKVTLPNGRTLTYDPHFSLIEVLKAILQMRF